jgi:hypothetical protein
MRNWKYATTFIISSSVAVALFACGSSSDDSGSGDPGGNPGVGGNIGTGGANTGGAVVVTGGAASGGANNPATGGTPVGTDGGAPTVTGGAPTLSGGSPATGGGVSLTGGNFATGGASVANGGNSATSPSDDVQNMCKAVCDLLSGTALDCVPDNCPTTCYSTYTKLKAAKAVCADDYVALYQCGLTQPASGWECYAVTFGSTTIVNIPIPQQGGPCNSQVATMRNVITANLTTCGMALSN